MADNDERLYPLNGVSLSGTTKSWAETLNNNFKEIDKRKLEFDALKEEVEEMPTPSDATITIQKNGANVDTFTLDQANDKTINITLAKGDVGLGNVDNVRQYSANNEPPYPVKGVTVNGTDVVNGTTKIAAVTVPTKDSDLATNDRYVRYDNATQALTDAQKSNARTNIGAGTVQSVGAEDGLEITGDASTTPIVGVDSAHKLPTTTEYNALATKTYVDTAIDNLPEPMVFKGTLGTGGTITTLPTAAASNEGFTYKVITDGTYASQAAKVGDVFVSNGSAWVLIPSGDDVEDTWRAINVNGTQLKGNGITSGPINFKNGGNVTVTGSGDDITLGVASGYSIPSTTQQTAWTNKQDALDAQTAYTAKGTSTKVPTITTNSLGQVTGITETDIAFPVTSVNGKTGAIIELAEKSDLNSLGSGLNLYDAGYTLGLLNNDRTLLDAVAVRDTTYGLAEYNIMGKIYEGQKFKSLHFDTSKSAELTTWLQSLTYEETSSGYGITTLIETADAGSLTRECAFISAIDLTSHNLGYGITLTYGQPMVLFATKSGSFGDMTWVQGFQNLDENGTFSFQVYSRVIDILEGDWNGSLIGYPVDANGYDGLMRASDKQKLDGIANGATKVEASSINGNIKINGVETQVYNMPAVDQKVVLSFDATGWTAGDDGYHTKTIATTKYPINCFNNNNKVVMATLGVTKSGTAVTAITIESDEPFAGYVVAL